MATTSEVKSGLDDISVFIKNARKAAQSAKAAFSTHHAILNAIPTTFADVLATIDAYGTTDAFEALSKAEKEKLQAEFVALRNSLNSAVSVLSAIDFTV